MRIKEIEIDNFRAYKTEEGYPFKLDIERDKPIILISGNNGLGKSSIYDAVEWGVTGKIERYDSPSREKNEYSILTNHFTGRKGGYVQIKFDTTDKKIKREIKESGKKDYTLGEPSLTLKEIKEILVKSERSKEITLENNFNSAHLLSQELINNFIKGTKETERYKVFLSLYGLNNEQKKVELIGERKKEIKKIISSKEKEIKTKEKDIRELESQVKIEPDSDKRVLLEEKLLERIQLKSPSVKDLENLIEANNREKMKLIKELSKEKYKKKLLKEQEKYNKDIEKIAELKDKIKNLKGLKKVLEKYEKIKEFKNVEEKYKEYLILRKTEREKQEENRELNSSITKLERIKKEQDILSYFEGLEPKKVQDYRRNKENIENNEREIGRESEEIKKLSGIWEEFELASKKILEEIEGNKCPLCNKDNFNKVDAEKNLSLKSNKNLSDIIGKKNKRMTSLKNYKDKALEDSRNILKEMKEIIQKELDMKNSEKDDSINYFNKLKELSVDYNKGKKLLEELDLNIEEVEVEEANLRKKLESSIKTVVGITNEINLKGDDIKELDTNELRDYIEISKKDKLGEVQKKLESISNNKIKIEDIIDISEKLLIYYKGDTLLEEIRGISKELRELEEDNNLLEKQKNDLDKLKDIIEKSTHKILQNNLNRYEEKIQSIYGALTPHRHFSDVKIRTEEKDGNNTLRIEVKDIKGNINNPAYLFSSAQSNVLALSIFLTSALDSNWSNLETIMLDDPIQNMDDINVFAFADIIKSISEKRQVFISTHDDRIKEFMLNKFGRENVQIVHFESYGKVKENI